MLHARGGGGGGPPPRLCLSRHAERGHGKYMFVRITPNIATSLKNSCMSVFGFPVGSEVNPVWTIFSLGRA